MSRQRRNSNYKNHRVLMVVDDELVSSHVVDVLDGKDVETPEGILPIEDAKKLYDASTGGITYIYNLDMPARVESTKLRELKRSVAIKNMMNYEKEKKFDLVNFMPWVIAVLALLV